MSKFVKNEISKITSEIDLTVKDTDFLLKLLMRSSFQGSEIEQCHSVLMKIAELHKKRIS
jgi:hypothetical protein